MGKFVVDGAMIVCTGTKVPNEPNQLKVLPVTMVKMGGKPAATTMDMVPYMNILPWKLCQMPANPDVIAKTAAALGTPVPGLCIPTVAGPWSPGSTKVKVKQMAALTDADTCNCVFGGTISIKMAGQMKVKEG